MFSMPNESEFAIKKSNLKEESLIISKKLAEKYKIAPYTAEELSEIILAGLRTGEIKLEKKGRSFIVKDIELWFKERLIPNTIVLSEEDYKRALYRAFRLLVLAHIAMTDFGSSRQRDFGQRWTDFTRGFLGEIGIEKFFSQKLGIAIKLEEKEIGNVERFLPSDITKIKKLGMWRDVKTDVSIKTSKLGSMWLDIGTQIAHSDAFIFIKISLTVDHLIHFFKSNGFLKMLVDMAKGLKEIENSAEEFKKLCDRIPDLKPFAAYIPGFAWDKDMERGKLRIYESPKSKRKKIVGGIGLFLKGMADSVEGLGEITPPKHLACLDSLRWSKKDWNQLKSKL
jgi:hypothetical protein